MVEQQLMPCCWWWDKHRIVWQHFIACCALAAGAQSNAYTMSAIESTTEEIGLSDI